MKNREKWITIAFLIFILVIPAVTVVRNMMPQTKQELTDEEKAILENNGTNAGGENTGENEAQTDEAAQPAPTEETAFTQLQNKIDYFTDSLFGRTKLIAFNAGLTSLLTGGTYIESTQVLMGKNNMLFYKTELDGHPPVWDYMGIDHFSTQQLEAIAANLVATIERDCVLCDVYAQ